jgi:hypothetical protein
MATVPIRPKGRPRKPVPEGQPEAEPSAKPPKKRVTKLSVMTEEERQAHMKEKSRRNYEKHCEAIKARKAAYKERNIETIRAQQRDRYHRLLKKDMTEARLIKKVTNMNLSEQGRQALLKALNPDQSANVQPLDG